MTAMSSTGSGPARSEHRISHSSQHSSDRPTSAHSRLNTSSKDGGFKEPEHADEKVNQCVLQNQSQPDDRPRRRDGELFAPRRRVTYKRIPFFSTPQSDEGLPWLSEDAVATEWLGLFYSELVPNESDNRSRGHINVHNLQCEPPAAYSFRSAVVPGLLYRHRGHVDGPGTLRYSLSGQRHGASPGQGGASRLVHLHGGGKRRLGSVKTGTTIISHGERTNLSSCVELGAGLNAELASQSFLTVAIVLATHCGLLAGQYVLGMSPAGYS